MLVSTKKCGLCCEQGHKVTSCPKIAIHGVPLPRGSNPHEFGARQDFLESLSKPKYWQTHFMEGDEVSRPLCKWTLPDQVRGIILHRRMFKQSVIYPWEVSDNYFFEITLLDTLGEVKHDYQKAFFELSLVQKFLTKCRTNHVINQMRLERCEPHSLGLSHGSTTQETPTQGASYQPSLFQLDDIPGSTQFLSKMQVARCPKLASFFAKEEAADLDYPAGKGAAGTAGKGATHGSI
jgi:hypothetical protein